MDVRLYIGNLGYSTTEEGLRQLLSQAGTVTSVSLVKDRDTGQSKGFAFATMATQAAAQKAIAQLHGHSLDGRPLTVNIARPREAAAGSKSRAEPPGYQSRLGAFGAASPNTKAKARNSGKSGGGYQSSLGAFGSGKSGPTPPRRRGGGQHR